MQNATAGAPAGWKEIKMFGGTVAEIATRWPGWQLCNGTNNTPDLRDRFIAGVSADVGGVAKTTVTGSATVSGDGQIPAHQHEIAMHSIGPGGGASKVIDTSNNVDPGYTESFGTGTKNVAVYYAMCFITRTADWA